MSLANCELNPWRPVIKMQPCAQVNLAGSNPRKHPKSQIKKLAESISRFGFVVPLIVDEENYVIAGEGCLLAARQLGLPEVPTICMSDLSASDKTALRVALNRLAELSEWDDECLKLELETLLADPAYPIEITGFEVADIDALLLPAELAERLEEVPEPPAAPVSLLGDLWTIGNHRVLCGDATDPAALERLMAGKTASMVFIDPPYNVPIGGHVSGRGKVKHREFVMGAGEMSDAEFAGFLAKVFKALTNVSADGSIHFVCMDWRHMREVLTAGDQAYTDLKNVITWVKGNAGMGSFYRSQHELIFVFKSGLAPHINNFGLGGKRYRTNVWNYAGANGFRKGREEDLAAHPTVKPIAMVADAIKDCSRRGDIIVDSFLGSGTTALAAHRTGRIGYGIELDPAYVDLIVSRIEKETGEKAVSADGLTFAETKVLRSAMKEAA